MNDPTFKKKMSERMWKIEGLFAEAKDNHGLARAKYRGRAKVQIQAYLTAMVQNLKRLVFFILTFTSMRPNPKSKSQSMSPIQLLQLQLIQHAGPFIVSQLIRADKTSRFRVKTYRMVNKPILRRSVG